MKPVDVDIPEAEPEPDAPPPELTDDVVDVRRTAFSWPGDAKTRFSEELLNGYIFDHTFTPAEKKVYLATNPDLPFINRLRIPDTDLIATGEKPDTDEDGLVKYAQWVKDLVSRFVGDKKKLFASMEVDGKLTLAPSEIVDDVPVRTIGAKTFSPIICSTGKNSVARMKVVAKYVDKEGKGVPAALKGNPLCIYAELLAREEHNMVWYTPEELKVLDSQKALVMKGLKAAK